MTQASARIVVAERWSVLRRGIVSVLQAGHTIVDHVDDALLLSGIIDSRPVDLALVGTEPDLDVHVVIEDLSRHAEAPAIVVLANEMDEDLLRSILQAGARGVFPKTIEDSTLIDGVNRVVDGDRVVDQAFMPLLFGSVDVDLTDDARDDASVLTQREQDVLVELARGLSNREIAAALMLGEATIKTHLVRIYAKLEVASRYKAVGRAVELGLLS